MDNRRRTIAGHNMEGLTSTGREQALSLAKTLALVEPEFDEIFSSDLQRAKETSSAIYESLPGDKRPICYSGLLREKGGGNLVGKPVGWAPLPPCRESSTNPLKCHPFPCSTRGPCPFA